MSAPATTTTEWQWPTDVLDFAAKHNVQSYLDPLLLATQRLFPTAQLRASVQTDPEIRDDVHIILEAHLPHQDVPDYVDAQHQWIRALMAICPAPLTCIFRLLLLTF